MIKIKIWSFTRCDFVILYNSLWAVDPLKTIKNTNLLAFLEGTRKPLFVTLGGGPDVPVEWNRHILLVVAFQNKETALAPLLSTLVRRITAFWRFCGWIFPLLMMIIVAVSVIIAVARATTAATFVVVMVTLLTVVRVLLLLVITTIVVLSHSTTATSWWSAEN